MYQATIKKIAETLTNRCNNHIDECIGKPKKIGSNVFFK